MVDLNYVFLFFLSFVFLLFMVALGDSNSPSTTYSSKIQILVMFFISVSLQVSISVRVSLARRVDWQLRHRYET